MFITLLVSLAILATTISFYRKKCEKLPPGDEFEVFCIENIKYISARNMFTVKYGPNGQVETCELEDF